MFSMPAVTDSPPGSSYKACFRNLPLETDCKHVQVLAGNGHTAYSNSLRSTLYLFIFLRAFPGLSDPASWFLASVTAPGLLPSDYYSCAKQ